MSKRITLEEAIKHCEEVAEKYCEKVEEGLTADDFCDSCASEHRQLAEWLLELRIYKRGIERIKELRDGFKQIPLSLEASILDEVLELIGAEGEEQTEEGAE